ncbi:zinc dependent phospholipase C family protein [Desulforudis sp. 1088]|uniref:zinc dependent phospholipase C family protein n=1 Tax=unclassified Candidatus Desulforudis TaxID=2635950 RepID=UPI003CE49666
MLVKRIVKCLRLAVLLPLLPALNWGPFTHPYINKRALEKANDKVGKSSDHGINLDTLRLLNKHSTEFIWGGNSADAVSAYHLLNDDIGIYDYAHNYVPDNARGVPEFGYRLINEWKQAAKGNRDYKHYSEPDFATACGWLAHQIADWYAHHAALDADGELLSDPSADTDGVYTFSGYSNSHRILGTGFYPEVLKSQTMTDHALVEFFHDALIYQKMQPEDLDGVHVRLFDEHIGPDGRPYNLLTDTSERYRGLASRICPGQIPALQQNFKLVLDGLRIILALFRFLRPSFLEAVRNSIDPAVTLKPDLVEMSSDCVVERLFAVSDAQLAELGKELTAADLDDHQISVRDVTRAGTVLFQLAYRLASFVDADAVVPWIESAEQLRLKFFWGLVDFRVVALRRLLNLIHSERFLRIVPRDHPGAAVLAFLSELLRSRSASLEPPRKKYRQLMPPVITLDGAEDLNDDEKISDGLARGTIGVTFTPALLVDAPFAYPYKDLDLHTLIFQINGYDVFELPDLYTVSRQWKEKILHVRCTLKKKLPPGYHYLRLDVADKNGVRAKPIEKEIFIRP